MISVCQAIATVFAVVAPHVACGAYGGYLFHLLKEFPQEDHRVTVLRCREELSKGATKDGLRHGFASLYSEGTEMIPRDAAVVSLRTG